MMGTLSNLLRLRKLGLLILVQQSNGIELLQLIERMEGERDENRKRKQIPQLK